MNVHPGSQTPANALHSSEGSLLRHSLLQVALIALTHGVVMVSPAFSQPTGYEGYQVVQIAITSEAELEKLRELQGLGRDFQVWSEGLGIGPMEVRVPPAAKPALDASGLCYEVVIEELQRHIDELYSSARGGDFFASLRTYDEHVQFMTDLIAAYPDLAEMILLGLSVERRPLLTLTVSATLRPVYRAGGGARTLRAGPSRFTITTRSGDAPGVVQCARKRREPASHHGEPY